MMQTLCSLHAVLCFHIGNIDEVLYVSQSYHSAIPAKDRNRVQELFCSNRIRVVRKLLGSFFIYFYNFIGVIISLMHGGN